MTSIISTMSSSRTIRFYQAYSLPLGTRHTLDLFVDSYDDKNVYLAAMRGPERGPYGELAAAQMRQAAAHFVRALKAHSAIARAEAAARHAEAALDGLRVGIAVVDASGRLLLANALAREAFARNACIDPVRAGASDSPLSRKLHDAAKGRPGEIRLRNGEDWLVSAVPLGSESPLAPSSRPAAMLVYRRASGPKLPPIREVQALYDLTAAEAAIALGIASGKSVKTVASERGVKPSTVRWQVQAVLRKLGGHRQADIMRVLAAVSPQS